MKCFTKKELSDCDIITQKLMGYKNIPANVEVKYIGVLQNEIGRYFAVRYKGIIYYVCPEDVEFIEG